MTPRIASRRPTAPAVFLLAWAVAATTSVAYGAGPGSGSGSKHVEPAEVVPLAKIDPALREGVAEVIRDHTIHRKSASDTFPCSSPVYLGLLGEPAITLALWKDLADSPVQLRRISAGRYTGSDGAGASATWEFAYKSPRLNVFYSNLDYVSPRGNTKLQGRIVLIVRSGFFRSEKGDSWIQHDVEAYVKVDSKGWKTLARTFRPLLEKVLEDQVQEAGLFLSLMGRLVETYPNWACQVAATRADADPEVKQAFCDAVTQNRRPNASSGRPVMRDGGPQKAEATTVRRRS